MLLACGDDGAPIAPLTDGPHNEKDAGAEEDKGNGPLVEILSPAPASDPSKDEVLAGATVTVRCSVLQKPGGAAVDPASVEVRVFSGDEVEPATVASASAKGVDTYEAVVSLGNVETGPVAFVCAAKDLDEKSPKEGRDRVESLYDRGPQIEFVTLNDQSIVPLGADESPDVTIQFSVVASPLAERDPEAEIADVTLDIDGVVVTPKLDEETDTYAYPLDFESLFAGAPITAAGVTVKATNKRTPKPVQATKTIGLTVDGAGPSIRILSPVATNGAAPIVGARVDVLLEIKDDIAGVVLDPEKLFATIAYGGEEYAYPIESKGGSSYSFTFFAARFSETANVTANIRAEDRAGNVSTTSHTMLFDTVPPYVTLTPPATVFAAKLPFSGCAIGFDPVARTESTAPQDGQVIAAQVRPRALIWERAIEPAGATEYWYSGVDNATPKLYFMEADAGPLLLNDVEDDDDHCDTIASDARELSLGLVKSAGSPPAGRIVDDMCEAPESFKEICDGSGLSYVLEHSMEKGDSVLYSTNPLSSGVGCAGTSIDLNTRNGWVCMVAVASDQAGNVAFSAPVRVCRSTKDGDCPGVPGEIVPVPSEFTCTDGCKLPPLMTTVPFPVDAIIPQN